MLVYFMRQLKSFITFVSISIIEVT